MGSEFPFGFYVSRRLPSFLGLLLRRNPPFLPPRRPFTGSPDPTSFIVKERTEETPEKRGRSPMSRREALCRRGTFRLHQEGEVSRRDSIRRGKGSGGTPNCKCPSHPRGSLGLWFFCSNEVTLRLTYVWVERSE